MTALQPFPQVRRRLYGPFGIGFQTSRIIAEIEKKPRIEQDDGRDRHDALHVDPLATDLLDQRDRHVAAVQRGQRDQVDQPDEQDDVANNGRTGPTRPARPCSRPAWPTPITRGRVGAGARLAPSNSCVNMRWDARRTECLADALDGLDASVSRRCPNRRARAPIRRPLARRPSGCRSVTCCRLRRSSRPGVAVSVDRARRRGRPRTRSADQRAPAGSHRPHRGPAARDRRSAAITSPGWMPAMAAGDGRRRSWASPRRCPAMLQSPRRRTRGEDQIPATRKCENGPARITVIRCQVGLAVYARCSSPSGTSFS